MNSACDLLVNIRRDAQNNNAARDILNRMDARIATFLDSMEEKPSDTHPIWNYYNPITNT